MKAAAHRNKEKGMAKNASVKKLRATSHTHHQDPYNQKVSYYSTRLHDIHHKCSKLNITDKDINSKASVQDLLILRQSPERLKEL